MPISVIGTQIKIVLTYYEYIFDFLKKCVPIMEIEENPVSVSGFLLKMHRLLSNVDFGYILLYAFVAQLVELLT